MSSRKASLSFFRGPRFRVWLKACAMLVAVSFIIPYLSWAFDTGNYALAKPNFLRIAHLGKVLTIPEKIGTINRGFQGNQKTIVCIQDLHCNYEVQKNIAGIIQHLVRKHELRLIGEEGASGTVNTAKIRTFPIKRTREQVGDYFVKQGKLTGAEYYAAASEHPMMLEGIETPDLYAASQKAVRSFLNFESQGYCCDLRGLLDELKISIYNPRLVKFDCSRMAYRKGDLNILKYSAHLYTTARRLKLDLSIYPSLAKFLSLNQNFFSPQVDPDQLFRELDQVDQDIRGHLYTSDIQQELDALYHRVDIIEKLLNISAAPEELQAFRTQRDQFSTQEFIQFISKGDSRIALTNSAIRESSKQTRNNYPGLPGPEITMLDHYLDKVEEFYRLADERSIHFADNLLEKMEREEENLAVMINGGFHTDKVLAQLQRRNVTYISIKPRVTRHDVVNPYFDLLRNRQSPLEELLAKNQTIMAIWTALDNKKFLAKLELIFKPLVGALELNAKELEQLKIYLAENNLIEVAMISESQALAAGLKNVDGVKIFSTTLKSETGEPIFVLLAPEGIISKRLEQKPIDSKTIAGTKINIYSSLQDAAKVTQAVQKSQSWISVAVAGIMEWVKGIPEKILAINNKNNDGVSAALTLPVLFKKFAFLPKRVVEIFIAPWTELPYTAPISLAAFLGWKIPKYEEIYEKLTAEFLGMHEEKKKKIKPEFTRRFRNDDKHKLKENATKIYSAVNRFEGMQWIIQGAKYGIVAGVFVGISLVTAAMLFGGALPLLGPMNIFTAMIIIIATPVIGFLMGNMLPHALYNIFSPEEPLSLLRRSRKPEVPADENPFAKLDELFEQIIWGDGALKWLPLQRLEELAIEDTNFFIKYFEAMYAGEHSSGESKRIHDYPSGFDVNSNELDANPLQWFILGKSLTNAQYSFTTHSPNIMNPALKLALLIGVIANKSNSSTNLKDLRKEVTVEYGKDNNLGAGETKIDLFLVNDPLTIKITTRESEVGNKNTSVVPSAIVAGAGTLNIFQETHEKIWRQLKEARWSEMKFSAKLQYFQQNPRRVSGYYLTHPITAGFTETIGIFGVLHGLGPWTGLLALDPTGMGFLTIGVAALVGSAFAILHQDVLEKGIGMPERVKRFAKRFGLGEVMIMTLILAPLWISPLTALALTIAFHVGWNVRESGRDIKKPLLSSPSAERTTVPRLELDRPITEYSEPLDKRNRLLDHVRFAGFRRGALLIMGAFFLMAAPVFAFRQPHINTLSADKTNQHGQMIGFKRSHGMTSIASLMKDEPENIKLEQVSAGMFLWHTVLSSVQRNNEFYLTKSMITALALERLNEDTQGLGQWFTRSFWAKQLLTYSLEHQTKLYENNIKWQVKLAKWGLYPLGRVLMYQDVEEKAMTIDPKRKTYAEYYKGEDLRNLTPVELSRIFDELIEDITISVSHEERIAVDELTEKIALYERLGESAQFLALKDGNEKLLEALESINNTIWARLLQEYRGKDGEVVVAAGIIEDVIKTASYESNGSIGMSERAKRAMETQEGPKQIVAMAAPETTAYMLEVLKEFNIQNNDNLVKRVDMFKRVLEAPQTVNAEAGTAVSLNINWQDAQALVGELDRLHAQDEALTDEMGEENGDKVYSICDPRQKEVVLKTVDGDKYAFLAPTIGEFIGKDKSKEDIIAEMKSGELHFFEFRGRAKPLSRESKPNIISQAVIAILMVVIKILTVRGRNIICPVIQKIFPSFAAAYFNHAVKQAIKDLIKKDGFEKAGIKIDKLALTQELTRPNSSLRQLYRRMAREPDNLRLQAEFAKGIVRFMIKYEKLEDKRVIKKQSQNRMHIMLAGRLAERLNTMPMIENYAKPDTGYETIVNWDDEDHRETRNLGDFSVFAILFPQELPEKDKKVLGVRGTGGALTDFLERNHFIVHEETREKYFKRTFELRSGSSV